MADREIDFDDLVGGEFDFYGCDGQCFNLDGLVYEVIEGDDGLEAVRICQDQHSFHDVPIARVAVEGCAFDDESYELVDLHDGHSWLRFGDEVTDLFECGYSTQFFFEYSPRGLGD